MLLNKVGFFVMGALTTLDTSTISDAPAAHFSPSWHSCSAEHRSVVYGEGKFSLFRRHGALYEEIDDCRKAQMKIADQGLSPKSCSAYSKVAGLVVNNCRVSIRSKQDEALSEDSMTSSLSADFEMTLSELSQLSGMNLPNMQSLHANCLQVRNAMSSESLSDWVGTRAEDVEADFSGECRDTQARELGLIRNPSRGLKERNYELHTEALDTWTQDLQCLKDKAELPKAHIRVSCKKTRSQLLGLGSASIIQSEVNFSGLVRTMF